MNFNVGNMRSRRNLLENYTPIHFPQYTTHSRMKTDMNFENNLFNLHLLPDPLKKNLADSVIREEKKMPETKEVKPNQREYYPFAGITNFISGVFNIMGAMFPKRSSPPECQYYDCFDDEKQMATPPWQTPNIEVLNKTEPLFCDDLVGMSVDCKLTATQCEEKLNQIQLLLGNQNVQTSRYRPRRPKKVFVEPSSVEESFEDACSSEDFVSLPNNANIETYSPLCYHDEVLTEAEAPEVKTEVKESMEIVKHIENESTTIVTKDIISSCEDKLSKLKALLQSKKSKPRETEPIAIPEVSSESVQNSNSEESDGFNEIQGKFFSSSVESDDSFQIVFADGPQNVRRRLPSECESEDSFIVFEESPDSCYSSNDVFGDDKIIDDSDSDVDEDSGYTCKLSPNLSRTFGDLTDNSLYSQDEVDSVSVCTIDKDVEPEVTEIENTGLLLDEKRKLQKKKLPPKKVQFSTQPPKVHVMRVWAFAARQARAGHWERHALDRERFKRRIADVEMAISWVLKPQHRSRIVFQRFRPWWNAQRRKELAEKEEKKKEAEKEQEESKETSTGTLKEDEINCGKEVLADNLKEKNEEASEGSLEVEVDSIESIFNGMDQLNIDVDEVDLPINDVTYVT